jgi:hypothetical protein
MDIAVCCSSCQLLIKPEQDLIDAMVESIPSPFRPRQQRKALKELIKELAELEKVHQNLLEKTPHLL